MNARWQITLVGLIVLAGLVVAQVSQQEDRTSGAPDEWQGAPATRDGLTLTVSAPASLRFQPDEDIPLTFTLGNGGTETAHVASVCGARLRDERGYRVIPAGLVDTPPPPPADYSALVDGQPVFVVPVAELKPGEEIIETVEDTVEYLQPLPKGTYTLIPVASVKTFDRDSVITRGEDERYTHRTCAQPESATSRFELATDPITIEILPAWTAVRRPAERAKLRPGPAVIVGNSYVPGKIKKVSGRLLVGSYDLVRLLGLQSMWHPDRQQLVIASDTHALVLSAGSNEAVRDGQPVRMAVAPRFGGRELLVPLRFVAETFGHKVIWEALPRIAWVR